MRYQPSRKIEMLEQGGLRLHDGQGHNHYHGSVLSGSTSLGSLHALAPPLARTDCCT